MIRLPVAERGFALALIASAAIHAALLPLLLSFASVPMHIRPVEEICITAFLVPGTLTAAGKAAALPARKPRQMDRTAPMAAAPSREAPAKAAPEENEGKRLPADIRPFAEWFERRQDAGKSPEKVFPQAPAVLIPEAGDSSGTMVSGISAARQGSGEFSRGKDTGNAASGREEMGAPQQESGAWPPKEADLVPRYGDNALPTYPPLARLRGYQGVAVLVVEVLADGRVGQVGISRSTGHEILDRTALEAVRSWKFEPGRREGRPVAMSVAVPVRFVLRGN